MYLVSVLSPLLGGAFAGLGGRYLGSRGSVCLTVLGLLTSFSLSVILRYEVGIGGSIVYVPLGDWFSVSTLNLNWGFYFDPLAVCMMCTVTGVSLVVHIYSAGYMCTDPHLPRFCSYLSLFTGGMRLRVTAPNMLQMLVGWEFIGVCSYLRIGFWFTRLNAVKSAQNAMIVNRISDTCLRFGVVLMWWYYGTTDYAVRNSLSTVAYYNDWICAMIRLGAMGKSAQLGLHIWLAMAMEGPTPVSALIHAATLVTAGVYLIVRTSPLWECSPLCRTILVFRGAATSLVAATCGFFQNDLKRVIAYSTCSQLGYMMVSCGLSHYGLAIYHLMTHACFKALLFRSAGVVIHAVADVQDVRRHGGVQARVPLAWSAMLRGSLSLVGWPFRAGFYSKDAILERTWSSSGPLSIYAYYVLMTVALFTSFYSFRLLWCSFVSQTSSSRKERPALGVPFTMSFPLVFLAVGSIWGGFFFFDMLVGWGTDFWQGSLSVSPTTGQWVASHFSPAVVAWYPLGAVILGSLFAVIFKTPLPFFAQSAMKPLYIFLSTRWQFDVVYNQQIALRVRNFGADTLAIIDKGVLERRGPKGLSSTLRDSFAPTAKLLQTGSVQDYALVFQWSVLIGLFCLAVPGSFGILVPFGIPLLDVRSLVLLFRTFFCYLASSESVSSGTLIYSDEL